MIVGEHLVAEMMPFYFSEDGYQFIEKAPFVYAHNIIKAATDHLEQCFSYVDYVFSM